MPQVRIICGPQYGSAVCCVVSPCNSTDSREISNDGNPSYPRLFTSFQHSLLDGAQVGPIKPIWTQSTNFYTFDHLAHYRSSNQRRSIKGPTRKQHPTPSNEIQRNSAGEYWLNRSPHSRWLLDDSWMILGWLLDDSWMTLGWLLDDSWMTLGWLLDDSWMNFGMVVVKFWWKRNTLLYVKLKTMNFGPILVKFRWKSNTLQYVLNDNNIKKN